MLSECVMMQVQTHAVSFVYALSTHSSFLRAIFKTSRTTRRHAHNNKHNYMVVHYCLHESIYYYYTYFIMNLGSYFTHALIYLCLQSTMSVLSITEIAWRFVSMTSSVTIVSVRHVALYSQTEEHASQMSCVMNLEKTAHVCRDSNAMASLAALAQILVDTAAMSLTVL